MPIFAHLNISFSLNSHDASFIIDLLNDAFGQDLARRKGRKGSQDSEHRRLLTNSRERLRQRTLNMAFQSLRDVIPIYPRDSKASKYSILKAAIKYIDFLDDVILIMEERLNEK